MASLKKYLKKVAKRSTELNWEPKCNEHPKKDAEKDTFKQTEEIFQINVRLPRKEVPFFERNHVTLIDR